MLKHDDSVLQVKDRQPLLTPEDCVLAEDIAKADPEVAAMVKEAYGITDLSLLACDPWSGGGPASLLHLKLYSGRSPALSSSIYGPMSAQHLSRLFFTAPFRAESAVGLAGR